MAAEPLSWQPDWAVPPGDILLEALTERGMSQSELARRMGRPTKTINEIVNGKTAITPETAIQLELTLGITAPFWNNLETRYREHLAVERSRQTLESGASWAKAFPVKDLIKHGLIDRLNDPSDRVAALLSFFSVGSVDAWESQWLSPSGSFRASPAFKASPPAVAAWLRWGERLAADIETAPFAAPRLLEVIPEIRALTRQADFDQTIRRIRDLLASAGVVLVLTPEFSGTHLSGVARWLSPDRALIQLSMRHKSNDQFWFSLFHEIGHLLEPKRTDYIDVYGASTSEATEGAADRFARDTLTPPGGYERFVDASDFSETAVRRFAKDEQVAPGIVVGRLQRDGHLARGRLNHLKKSLTWLES